jgi:hypothetical protein
MRTDRIMCPPRRKNSMLGHMYDFFSIPFVYIDNRGQFLIPFSYSFRGLRTQEKLFCRSKKVFLQFKGLGSFKKIFLIGGNVDDLQA